MTRRTPQRLLYVSPVPLGSFAQRPHHFVHWFHERHAAQVLWIDPGPSRLPRLSDGARLRQVLAPAGPALGPLWRNEAWLQHVPARVLPVEPYAWGRSLNRLLWQPLLKQVDAFVTPDTLLVLGKPCALSLALVLRYPGLRSMMDAMDHMPGFLTGVSRDWMVEAERDLAERVDDIWASSHALVQLHRAHADKVHLVLNGLTPPQTASAPSRAGHHVLGYLGVMDRWFDWPLVLNLARKHPHVTIELVGPVHGQPKEALPGNIRCLPAVAQHDVYQAMSRFDAGLIPFVNNDVTRYVDPVKYYEYRALGLPVLSTRFGEMNHRGEADGVHFWDELGQGGKTLESVLAARWTEVQRQQFCERNSWPTRFDQAPALVPG